MAYVRIGKNVGLAGLGCGPGCTCAPCQRAQFSGFGEHYIRDEDFFRSQAAPEPPGPPSGYNPAPNGNGYPSGAPPMPFPPGAAPPPPVPGAFPRSPGFSPSPSPGVTVTPNAAAQLDDYGWTVRPFGTFGGIPVPSPGPRAGARRRARRRTGTAAPQPGSATAGRSEIQLIQDALGRGIRDLNRLTDLVFHARHPERRGAPIRPDEQTLVAEWREIRDRLVRPALTPGAPAPPPAQPETPTQPVLPAPNIATLKQNLVRLAVQEWNRWDKGRLKEHDPRMRRVLEDYWKGGVGWLPAELNWWSAVPWSAAFISWLMRKAGAGKAFAYSPGHAVYIKAAKENRLAGNSNPFKAYRINEAKPAVGDLVCKPRANSGANYENIRPGMATHCDVVTAVQPGRLITIGGNVSNSVWATPVRIDANGLIQDSGYFAVIKLGDRGANGPV